MKLNSSKTLLTIICIAAGIFCNAQTAIKYTSPEEAQYAPISVRASDAKQEASALSTVCGYTSSFFSKQAIEDLMSHRTCIGVRIYNAKSDQSQAMCDMVAVAVDENGKEVGPALGKKYLHARSFDNDSNCPSSKVSKSNARNYVSNVANTSALEYQKVFFSKALIETLLTVPEATGITVIPGNLNGQKTMMASAAKLDKGKVVDLGGSYMKSKLPCPYDCGDTGNYLVEPK